MSFTLSTPTLLHIIGWKPVTLQCTVAITNYVCACPILTTRLIIQCHLTYFMYLINTAGIMFHAFTTVFRAYKK